jgi:DNA-binding GntR family transcriptional regulator
VTSIALITQSTGIATVEEWAKLNLNAPNSRVLRLTRVRRDTAVTLEEAVLPLERFPGLIADASDITELARCYGLSLGHATERVSIVPATRKVAKHLGIAAGADVLKLDRIVETASGEPIEWRVTFRKS